MTLIDVYILCIQSKICFYPSKICKQLKYSHLKCIGKSERFKKLLILTTWIPLHGYLYENFQFSVPKFIEKI